MSTDLETRVAARKQDLLTKLSELTNTQQSDVVARDRIKAQLSQLAHIVKGGVVDGWAVINDATRTKLDDWLVR